MIQQLQFVRAWVMSRRDERGATAVEYGIMVALIAAVIIATVVFLGQDVLDAFNIVEEEIDGKKGG